MRTGCEHEGVTLTQWMGKRAAISVACTAHTSLITLHTKATEGPTYTPSFPPFYPNRAAPASTLKKKPSPRVLPAGDKHTDLCPLHTANTAPPSVSRTWAALCLCLAHKGAKELLLTKAEVFKSHKRCKRNIHTERPVSFLVSWKREQSL